MSRSRKPNSVNPSTANPGRLEDLATRQLKSFAKNMAVNTGVPEARALWGTRALVITDVPRECASCGQLHRDFSALAFFRRADISAVVLWSQCEACQDLADTLTGDALDLFNDSTEGRLLAWASGSVEPIGAVIIFRFTETEVVEEDG